MQDEDVTSRKGIYQYVLFGDEKHLNIRQFKESDKRYAYEGQFGICVKCGEHFSIEEMEADHILPWSKGGKTDKDNCQMLCKQCNRRKSDK
jgi:5-methylcytosine-specific restriction endonuclease McrA